MVFHHQGAGDKGKKTSRNVIFFRNVSCSQVRHTKNCIRNPKKLRHLNSSSFLLPFSQLSTSTSYRYLARILKLILKGWGEGNPFIGYRSKPEISWHTAILSEIPDSIFKAHRQCVGFLSLHYIHISKWVRSTLRDFSWVIHHLNILPWH